MSYDPNMDREGAPYALVADLSERLADLESGAIDTPTPGVIYFADGRSIDYRQHLPRPLRRAGQVTVADPDSFVRYLDRFATVDTMIYADVKTEQVIGVLNDHPETDGRQSHPDVEAGRRDDLIVLDLRTHDDWAAIVRANGQLVPQREFAEWIEDMAHRVDDSARMLEVAQTLDVRQNIDLSSKVRLQSGDVQFRFEQTSEARAGRGDVIEIPTRITLRCPIWQGTEAVEIDARFRFKGDSTGVRMGFRLVDLTGVTERAFRDLVDEIDAAGQAPAALYGDPMVGLQRRIR